MGIYAGRTTSRQFMSVINTAMLASGYQAMLPTSDGGKVYKSTEEGTNEFYIKLRDPGTNVMIAGFYKTYTANGDGTTSTLADGYELTTIRWNSSLTTDIPVAYILNINSSRAIIQCEGLPLYSGYASSLNYIGMPKRYDPADTGANFGGVAASSGVGTYANTGMSIGTGSYGYWRPVLRRTGTAGQYFMEFYPIARSYGWGNQIFFSPMIIGDTTEGPRGEMDGLYYLEPGDNKEFQHGDVFTQNGKTYIILNRTLDIDGNAYLPLSWYVLEVKEGLTYGLLYR